MSLTPNFGMNIPDATDIVNLLTQCYPNFTIVDTAMQAIKETGVTTATETKSGTTHQITRTDADCNVLRFTSTSNFVTGDTFTVDGNPVTGVAVNGTSLQTGDFVINSDVLAILNNNKLTLFAGGAAAPDASDVNYDNTGSGLTATDVQNAIDEIVTDISNVDTKYGIYATGTLVAGNTSLTISNVNILANSLIDVYFEDASVNYTNITGVVGSVTIDVPAQASNMNVVIRITNLF